MLKKLFSRALLTTLASIGLLSSTSIASAETLTLSVEEAHKKASNGAISLIDIRTPAEWEQSGTPEHAELVQLQRDDFVETILAKHNAAPDKPIALICRSGGRSTRAAQMLEQAGLQTLYNVTEGANGWRAKGLPVEEYSKD